MDRISDKLTNMQRNEDERFYLAEIVVAKNDALQKEVRALEICIISLKSKIFQLRKELLENKIKFLKHGPENTELILDQLNIKISNFMKDRDTFQAQLDAIEIKYEENLSFLKEMMLTYREQMFEEMERNKFIISQALYCVDTIKQKTKEDLTNNLQQYKLKIFQEVHERFRTSIKFRDEQISQLTATNQKLMKQRRKAYEALALERKKIKEIEEQYKKRIYTLEGNIQRMKLYRNKQN